MSKASVDSGPLQIAVSDTAGPDRGSVLGRYLLGGCSLGRRVIARSAGSWQGRRALLGWLGPCLVGVFCFFLPFAAQDLVN